MEQNITIKRVDYQDAEELLEIYSHYVENTAVSFEWKVPTPEEFQRRIQTISAKYPYIKAVHEGRIVGYAYAGCFKPRESYDYSVETTIYLRSDYHGRGIGRALYETLEKSLKDMGVLNMNACIAAPRVEDAYLTEASMKFHEHMGFTLVGRFHNSGYKFQGWYDMVWMEKLIGEHADDLEPVRFGQWKI